MDNHSPFYAKFAIRVDLRSVECDGGREEMGESTRTLRAVLQGVLPNTAVLVAYY